MCPCHKGDYCYPELGCRNAAVGRGSNPSPLLSTGGATLGGIGVNAGSLLPLGTNEFHNPFYEEESLKSNP